MRLLLALICSSLVCVAWADDDDSIRVLKSVQEKSEKARYAGIRTVYFRKDGKLKTNTEYVLRSKGKTRIDFDSKSDFAGQIIYEQENKRYTYIKASNELKLSGRRPVGDQLEMFFRPEHRRDFDLDYQGTSRIAGRECHKIKADFGRHSLRIYVDKSHSVILRREIEDSEGEKIAGYTYSKIDFSPDFKDSHLDPPKGAKLITVYDVLETEAKALGFRAYALDRSTEWTLVHVSKTDSKDIKILRSFYVKDRHQVSLAQLPRSSDVSDIEKLRPKGTESYVWTEDGYKFVLIGNLSESDLRQLARRIKVRKLLFG